MAGAKKTAPGDQLAEVDAELDAQEAEREGLDARRGDAEALIRSYPDRRENALTLRKLGEEVEVPDEAEQARLQRFVSDAKAEGDAINRARPRLEERKLKIIAAGLPHIDGESEADARAFESECDAVLAGLDSVQARQAAKEGSWRRSKDGRTELGRQMPGVSYLDLEQLRGVIKDAKRGAWPGNSEEAWREFKAREQAPPGARLSNAQALAQFGGEAA
jgi:hypothetical protein